MNLMKKKINKKEYNSDRRRKLKMKEINEKTWQYIRKNITLIGDGNTNEDMQGILKKYK